MPQQEVFLEQRAGDRLITVLKTYDRSYAREVFVNVDDEAKKRLMTALEVAKNYDPKDIPDCIRRSGKRPCVSFHECEAQSAEAPGV